MQSLKIETIHDYKGSYSKTTKKQSTTNALVVYLFWYLGKDYNPNLL
jgi:hypothetical protein